MPSFSCVPFFSLSILVFHYISSIQGFDYLSFTGKNYYRGKQNDLNRNLGGGGECSCFGATGPSCLVFSDYREKPWFKAQPQQPIQRPSLSVTQLCLARQSCSNSGFSLHPLHLHRDALYGVHKQLLLLRCFTHTHVLWVWEPAVFNSSKWCRMIEHWFMFSISAVQACHP